MQMEYSFCVEESYLQNVFTADILLGENKLPILTLCSTKRGVNTRLVCPEDRFLHIMYI